MSQRLFETKVGKILEPLARAPRYIGGWVSAVFESLTL